MKLEATVVYCTKQYDFNVKPMWSTGVDRGEKKQAEPLLLLTPSVFLSSHSLKLASGHYKTVYRGRSIKAKPEEYLDSIFHISTILYVFK
jgi:hypothetical protein